MLWHPITFPSFVQQQLGSFVHMLLSLLECLVAGAVYCLWHRRKGGGCQLHRLEFSGARGFMSVCLLGFLCSPGPGEGGQSWPGSGWGFIEQRLHPAIEMKVIELLNWVRCSVRRLATRRFSSTQLSRLLAEAVD